MKVLVNGKKQLDVPMHLIVEEKPFDCIWLYINSHYGIEPSSIEVKEIDA